MKEIIQKTLVDLGAQLKTARGDTALYIQQRMAHIDAMAAVGEPGIERSIAIEIKNIALFMGIQIDKTKDATELKVIGFVTGLIRLAAAGIV